MPTQTVPGVYIQEISTLPASIAPVSTAVPAFVGYTTLTTKDGESLVNKAIRITSMLEFEETFGGPNNEAIALVIDDQYDSSDNLISRTFSASLAAPSPFNLYYSMQMYFSNGGGPCYVVTVGDFTGGTIDPAAIVAGLAPVEKKDEPTLLVFPDAGSLSTLAEYGLVAVAAMQQCAKLQDRFAILDAISSDGSLTSVNNYRNVLGNDNLKYGASYYPFLKTLLNFGYSEVAVNVTHNKTGGTPPATPNFTGTLAALAPGGTGDNPAIHRALLAEIKKLYVVLPPSGSMAGVYARVDADRGVWKAPANVSLFTTLAPDIRITNEIQDYLNVDATSGKSINAIRTFAGKGIIVWGARTLAGNDNEWRYVPVRRLFIFIEESVKKASEFVVFEPNVKNTWVRVKAMIENFLTGLWKEGALAGAKPENAFFVKVGLGETMTAIDILEGRMNVEIGLAAVRPAEFIILKFSHKLQES